MLGLGPRKGMRSTERSVPAGCGHGRKPAVCEPGRKPPVEPGRAGALIVDFRPPDHEQ